MMCFVILFWFFFSLIIYSYAIYPAMIQIWAGNKILSYDYYKTGEEWPQVAILMSVLNEGLVIEEKIKSIFNTSYPADKITLWIGSDNSTDNTNQIIEQYSRVNKSIRFFSFSERKGKTAVLNALQKHISKGETDILIYTDANVFFDTELITEVVKYFKDTKIGLVGANVYNTIPGDTGIALQEKSYIQRENIIKYNEGVIWGTMQGAFGACYAIRMGLTETFPSVFVADDFFLSMNVLKKGYKAILNKEARCYEDVSINAHDEYRRKARISAGNFNNLSIYKRMLLNPFTSIGFTFISHKLLRWLAPFMLVLMPVFCLLTWNKFYIGLFVIQVFLMMMPIWDRLLNVVRVRINFIRLISYFYYMNLALLNGFFQYINGVKSHGWTPTPRNV